MTYTFELNLKPYNQIKNKIKDVELRLFDDKRKVLKVGDYINFHSKDLDECVLTKIVGLHQYKDFYELLKHIDINRTGLDNPEEMYLYYSKDKIESLGVLGIEIVLVSNK